MLVLWIRHTADILFVLGYCVIAFLKLCFLGILRYEIKEMIQKIKLLQTEMAQSILNAEMGEQHLQQVRQSDIQHFFGCEEDIKTFSPTPSNENEIKNRLRVTFPILFVP